MNNIRDTFNELLLSFAEQLAKACPNSIISNNIGYIKNIIDNNPNSMIELFVVHVLPDKEKIDSGDDDYFIGKSYSEIIGNDSVVMTNAFEFKKIWGKLTEDNKAVVKGFMQILAEQALEYFIISDEINSKKK